jgi:Nucleoside 2-deoxyribosyltransferase
MDSKNKTISTCLISAPFGADLGALPRVLDKSGIHWEWAKHGSEYSDRLPGDIRRIIRHVDFVIAVLTDQTTDNNTLFEIGVAVGIEKPVLLILPIERKIPLKLETVPYVRVPLEDEQAIALHLDLLIRNIRMNNGRFRYPVSEQLKTIPTPVVPKDGHREGGLSLQAEIVDLIEQAGGQVLLQNPDAAGFRPDLLVWFPEQDPELFNPAVIELKNRPLSATRLTKIENQLVQFLENTGVRIGMIVAPEVEAERPTGFRGSPAVNVFFINVERFRELLRTGQLADHLRRERNRAAHGLR